MVAVLHVYQTTLKTRNGHDPEWGILSKFGLKSLFIFIILLSPGVTKEADFKSGFFFFLNTKLFHKWKHVIFSFFGCQPSITILAIARKLPKVVT